MVNKKGQTLIMLHLRWVCFWELLFLLNHSYCSSALGVVDMHFNQCQCALMYRTYHIDSSVYHYTLFTFLYLQPSNLPTAAPHLR